MIDQTITNRYARALLNKAKKDDQVQSLYSELFDLIQLLQKEPKIVQILEAPHIASKSKLNFVERVLKNRFSPLMVYLIELLCIKNRAQFLMSILERYREIVDIERGVYDAEITTARELGLTEKDHLKNVLEKRIGKSLKVEYNVKKEILGGIIFKFKDHYIDHSVLGRWKDLRDHLYEIKVII